MTIENLDHGIYAIDTGMVRPFFDASHLVVENGRAAFVDVGTAYSVPGCSRRSRSSASRATTSTT